MNRRISVVFTIMMACFFQISNAKDVTVYKTFIYTSEDLAEEIQKVNEAQDDTRRFDIDLLNASLGAAKGIGAGYISSFIDLGVNALGSLITKSARQKQEWEEMVKKENVWSTKISSIQDVKDFYCQPSSAGALDPLNMNFDGIGCLRMEGTDTVFFVSCHIDRSKLNRIVNHSKFELVLDTLIVSPYHSNLPNTQLPIGFSFDERGKFDLSMIIKISSSWFTDAIELHSDELLGEFELNIPIYKDDVDSEGYLKYVRASGEPSKYSFTGESFIIPRSYMGYRDASGKYRNIWGTGQYKLNIELKESCGISKEYRDGWKADRKKRQKMMKSQSLPSSIWQTITSQQWDEITKSWIITTISAPAEVLKKEVQSVIGLTQPIAAKSAVTQSMQSSAANKANSLPKKQ